MIYCKTQSRLIGHNVEFGGFGSAFGDSADDAVLWREIWKLWHNKENLVLKILVKRMKILKLISRIIDVLLFFNLIIWFFNHNELAAACYGLAA